MIWLLRDGIASIRASDVMSYEMDTAGTLRQVTAARVPLENAENTRILTYRSPDGGRGASCDCHW